jgi:hypothetical protein
VDGSVRGQNQDEAEFVFFPPAATSMLSIADFGVDFFVERAGETGKVV